MATYLNNWASTLPQLPSAGILATDSTGLITSPQMLAMPTTTSTVGQVTINGNRFMHSYGSQNTFVGENAGNFTLTGTLNSGFGESCLSDLSSGYANSAFGVRSGKSLTSGIGNCSLGWGSLYNATSSSFNIAIGYEAMASATATNNNVAIGQRALHAHTTSAGGNVGVGYRAFHLLQTGVNDIGLGAFAGLQYTTNESNCICIGSQGVAGDSGHIRIGTPITHTKAFIAGINGVTPATAGARVTLCDSSGQLGTLGAMTNGQLIIGSTGANPAVASLTSTGGTITVTAGAGTLNVDVAAGGGMLTYEEITAANKTIVNNYEYGANNAGGVAFTLPATAAVGTRFAITGIAGLWSITQGASQVVRFGSTTTTAGAGTKVVATDAGDCVTCTCIVADTVWRITNAVGNITIS